MSYIDGLGVRQRWRRRGVGLALLHHSFGEFHWCGKRNVALDVDAQNLTGAPHLCERTGMRFQRQTVMYERELRSGADLRMQLVDG